MLRGIHLIRLKQLEEIIKSVQKEYTILVTGMQAPSSCGQIINFF